MKIAVFGQGTFCARVVEILGTRSVCVVTPERDGALPDAYILNVSTMPFILDAVSRCDLGLLAWWPRKLAEPYLSATRLGWLNTHPSLLPFGRGRDPYFWALVNGDPYGATIHWVTPEIDAGPIAWQRAIPIAYSDTAATLRERARATLLDLLRDGLADIDDGSIPSYPQYSNARPRRRHDMLDRCDYQKLTHEQLDVLNMLRGRTAGPGRGFPIEVGGTRWLISIKVEGGDDNCRRES